MQELSGHEGRARQISEKESWESRRSLGNPGIGKREKKGGERGREEGGKLMQRTRKGHGLGQMASWSRT